MNVLAQEFGERWALYHGDSAEVWRGLPDNSIDLSVYSPPFLSLYTYSPSERDMGNCRDEEEFIRHFGFLVGDLLRTTKPGRLTVVHCADVQATLSRDGFIGRKDFPGMVTRAYEQAGWAWGGRIIIDKNPQPIAVRTHSSQLQFSDVEADSAGAQPAICDQLLIFRKAGKNAVPIKPQLTRQEWILWARPVWYAADYLPGTWAGAGDQTRKNGAPAGDMGIKETDTLNVHEARGENDERHIAPLQLGTVERIVKLYSNAGETVATPFAGIGTEVYQAVRFGRRGLGCELNPVYFGAAVKNLRRIESESRVVDLFTHAELAAVSE